MFRIGRSKGDNLGGFNVSNTTTRARTLTQWCHFKLKAFSPDLVVIQRAAYSVSVSS